MWRKGKKRTDEGPAGADDVDGGPARKKPAREPDDDGIVVCDISKNRRVSVRSWQGKVVVDIREFYTKDGKEMPGKKASPLAKSPPSLRPQASPSLAKTSPPSPPLCPPDAAPLPAGRRPCARRTPPLPPLCLPDAGRYPCACRTGPFARWTLPLPPDAVAPLCPPDAAVTGISLTMDQWNILKEHVDEIDKAVSENA